MGCGSDYYIVCVCEGGGGHFSFEKLQYKVEPI